MSQRVIWLIVLTVLFCSSSAISLAEEFPSRAVTTIVPLPPGENRDFLAAIFASVAEKYLGKPVVVRNKTGAEGLQVHSRGREDQMGIPSVGAGQTRRY